jgi:twinfilin-like protein
VWKIQRELVEERGVKMARANLSVNSEISEAFVAANSSDGSIRLLKVSIDHGTESLVLNSVINRVGTRSDDFDNIIKTVVVDNEAALLLYNLNDGQNSNEWGLLAWIPDLCRVRDKMLYASSREDLKRTLGIGYFVNEYYVSNSIELNWAAYQDSTKKGNSDKTILSTKEQLILEEKSLTQSESANIKSSAMTVLPFKIAPEVLDSFKQFNSNQVNWIELSMESTETIKLVSNRKIEKTEKTCGYISDSNASYIIYNIANDKNENTIYFCFSCPENVPIKNKMTMSSAKATVISYINEYIQYKISKSVEIRDVQELDDIIKAETVEVDSVFSSNAAAINNAKPQKPGRKGSNIPKAKFVADEL